MCVYIHVHPHWSTHITVEYVCDPTAQAAAICALICLSARLTMLSQVTEGKEKEKHRVHNTGIFPVRSYTGILTNNDMLC